MDFTPIYECILRNIQQNPQEIHTIRLNDDDGLWFSVFVKNERIFVSPATEHTPASDVFPNTPISKIDLEQMFPLVCTAQKRRAGISGSVAGKPRNSLLLCNF